LLAAVVIHGFGWVYLSRQRNDEPGTQPDLDGRD